MASVGDCIQDPSIRQSVFQICNSDCCDAGVRWYMHEAPRLDSKACVNASKSFGYRIIRGEATKALMQQLKMAMMIPRCCVDRLVNTQAPNTPDRIHECLVKD